MRIGILGPVEVHDDDVVVEVSGRLLRRLLTRLALDAGRPVSATEIVDALWPDDPPADTAGALQSLVSRLRRVLGDRALVRQAGSGYLLAISQDDVDANAFARSAAHGRRQLAAGEAHAAHDTLADALALWRGPALQDADGAAYAIGPAARLEDERLDAIEARLGAALDLGWAADVVAELDELTRSHPLRERFTAQLMRALADTGRVAEALAAFERLRTTLAELLGTDPGPEVSATHLRVLRGEESGPTRPRAAPPRASRRTNLPASLTSFVGRDTERARVEALLDEGRLVTIVGPGGAGKTRVAMEVARGLVDSTPGGVWLVPLAPVVEEADLAEAFLAALELREARVIDQRRRQSHDTTSRLVEELEDRECLLLVDNCEHVIGGAARLVDEILRAAPGMRVIATSREPLGIDGESITSLPPLALPPVGASAKDASRYAAVSLFVDRAVALRADFALDDSTVESVVEIVRRLDGMPLAIELAAARARVLPVGEVARRLTDRFRLLTGGSRATLPRHQTLRAVVDWSWELLSAEERLLAERLAVFPSGATARAASEVCGGDALDAVTVVELLDALADKSIVVASADDVPGRVRYRMLETIREYGLERLAARGESEAVRTRHAAWFGALVERLDPMLRGRDQLSAIAELTAERDNILGALRFHLDRQDGAAALAMAVRLMWFWSLTGGTEEATTWLSLVLGTHSTTPVDPALSALAEAGLAVLAFVDPFASPAADETDWQARVVALSDRLEEYLAELQCIGLPTVVLRAGCAIYSGDDDRAARVVEEGLASEDPWERAAVRMFRAKIAENEGDLDTVRSDVEVALDEFDAIGDRWGMASVLASLGYLRGLDGDIDGAVAAYEEAATIMALIGAGEDRAFVATRLAGLHLSRGDYDRALAELAQIGPDLGAGQFAVVADTMRLYVLVARSGGVPLGPDPSAGTVSTADRQAVEAVAAGLEAQVRAQVPVPSRAGHSTAVALTALGLVRVALGDLDRAEYVLDDAHRVALGTHDGPIIAGVGTVVATLRAAQGRPAEAATVLGAADRARGAADRSDPFAANLTRHLRQVLGEGYSAAYELGWALDRASAGTRLGPVAEGDGASGGGDTRR